MGSTLNGELLPVGAQGAWDPWPSLNLAVSMLRPERCIRREALVPMCLLSVLYPFSRKGGLGRRPGSSERRVHLGDEGRHRERASLTAVRNPGLKPQATTAAPVLVLKGLQPGSIWKTSQDNLWDPLTLPVYTSPCTLCLKAFGEG